MTLVPLKYGAFAVPGAGIAMGAIADIIGSDAGVCMSSGIPSEAIASVLFADWVKDTSPSTGRSEW